MAVRALCPVLVGRENQLFVLEDALLAANRGESRFVALGAEAGMGKTRLATELAKRADRLDWEVLWGACSEAEFQVPYLPLVEALGNYISGANTERLTQDLGGAARELAQLFPQLGVDLEPSPVGEPAQAKLRLFEAIVALLSLPARERGLLLVLEDVHWADSATREVLDHLARRLTRMRSLLLVTYRSDELDRRHPLTPLIQRWRRSGVAELVSLTALDPAEVGTMIAAILDQDAVGPALRDSMYRRSEGNPFVLEEMLKEALDRGDVARAGGGSGTLDDVAIPETVRDTILLRFGRLDEADGRVLEAAAVLGRTFEYDALAAIAGSGEAIVHRALQIGVAQQMLENVPGGRATYRWRHALTQEAVADEIVLPRRQQIHGRAADALAAAGAPAVEIARHLLRAARFDETVPACIAAAEEAEASLAFAEALELLEHALPHARDPLVRSRLLCRMGRLLWMDGKTAAAESVLLDGVAGLEAAGEAVEAASYRLVLGRCRWEQSRPDLAQVEFERARAVLEEQAPSAELAHAYTRLAGLHHFSFDNARALVAAEKAVATAELAGADFERVWALSWLALVLLDAGRPEDARATLDASFDEARRCGYTFIAQNIAYNDTWIRIHTMTPRVGERLEAIAAEPGPSTLTDMLEIAESWIHRTEGDLAGAREAIERAQGTFATAGEKVRWRGRVELGEVRLELGRIDEAAATLPAISERAELQDTVYDGAPQIRVRLATGRTAEAVELAREIARDVGLIAPYHDVVAVAVEALVAAGMVDEAQQLVDAAAAHPSPVGKAFLEEARGRILLARGDAAQARDVLAALAREAAARGFRLVEWRARVLAAEALGIGGDRENAGSELAEVAGEADAAEAVLIADSARQAAQRLNVSIPEREERTSDAEPPVEPELVGAGERLVTSMFADVRGFTRLASVTAPSELADRLGALHRWAAAEVARHHGFVDKFAGDAVMATFNATGSHLDHTTQALEAALALSGKAAMLDLELGIGIAVGPAVVGRTSQAGNISVLGSATNLAARLQTAAAGGEIVLSDEAHRRVASWLAERGLTAEPEQLELKGFDGAQPAYRLANRVRA